MRFLRRGLTGLFLMSLTLGLMLWAGVVVFSAVQERMGREAQDTPARERVFAVNVVTARAADMVPVLEAFGEVTSRRSLEVRAAVGGRVIELDEAFVEGGRVRAGQLLARIDPAQAQSALERARSDLSDAEAEARDAARGLELARDEVAAAQQQADLRARAFDRQSDLQSRGVGTAAAVEAAELTASSARQAVLSRRQALAAAEARVDQAATALSRVKLALAQAERDLVDTEITAAFDGALSAVNIARGGLVSVNERLATLIDPEALEVSFRVSTAQYARLLGGDGRLADTPVEVRLDLGDAVLTARGRIVRESAAVAEGQTGRLIYAQLGGAGGLKPGDFVSVHIEEPLLASVVRLPASAMDATRTVLAVRGDDRLEAISVTLLRRQGDAIIIAATGAGGQALDGRTIVAKRSPLLGAGIKVRALAAPDESGAAPEPQGDAMLELTDERRARLVAFIEASERLPDEMKTRILGKLSQPTVPASMVERIEARMGG